MKLHFFILPIASTKKKLYAYVFCLRVFDVRGWSFLVQERCNFISKNRKKKKFVRVETALTAHTCSLDK